MKDIIKYSTGTKWEEFVGYSRAVQYENKIITSGTTASDENGKIVGINDPYLQTKFIIQKVEKILKELGSSLDKVIKTVIYTTDIKRWEEIGKGHGEFFKDIRPVTTMVEITGLVDPDMIVEIEFTALI